MTKINVQINNPALAKTLRVPVDTVVPVKSDRHGVPLDRYWRRRLADARRDGSVTVLADRAAPVVPTKLVRAQETEASTATEKAKRKSKKVDENVSS